MADVTPSGGDGLTVEVRDKGSSSPVVVVAGELDYSTADRLARAVEPLAAPTAGLAFDLSDFRFMDSSGLAILLRTRARVGSVRLIRPSSIVTTVLQTTGVADMFTIEP